jgi:hypothetical protein
MISHRSIFLALLFCAMTAVHADVKTAPKTLQVMREADTGSLRPPIKAADIENAPLPGDDDPPAGGAPNNSSGSGSAASSGTGTQTAGVITAAPLNTKHLSQSAIIGLVVLSLLSLGSVWASVRLIRGEWNNQAA